MKLFDTLLGRTKPVQPNLDALFGLPSAMVTLESAAGMTGSGRAGICYKPPTGQSFEDMQAEVMKLLSMDGGGTLRRAEDGYGYHWVVVENPDVQALVTQVHMVNSSLADSGWGSQLLCSLFGIQECPDADQVAAMGSGPVDPGPVDPALAGGASSAGPSSAGPSSAGEPTGQAATPGTAPGTAPGTTTPGAEEAAGPSSPPSSSGPPSVAYLVYLFKRGTFYPFAPDGKEHRNTEMELKLRSLVDDDLAMETELDRWFPLWDQPVG